MTPWTVLERPIERTPERSFVDRFGFGVGWLIDEASVRYEAWRIGRAGSDSLRRRAGRYREAVEHLERAGVLDEPAAIFPAPRDVPGTEHRPMSVLGLPPFESVRFASSPVRVFPEALGTEARDPGGRNLLAYAYLWRHGGRGRRTVVCIHGYRGGTVAIDARTFGTARLFADGVDVALAVLPYHGPRTPAGSTSGLCFLNDPRRTLEAVAQAIGDLRTLIAWLRREGAGPIGVTGFSLGGYMTALLASLEPDLDFAVPVIPVASFADLMWERAGRRGEHETAVREGLDLALMRRLFAAHCPLHHSPRVDPERRLVIAGEADRIAPPAHAAALARHWKTGVRWFPGGHLAQLGRGPALAALHRLAREGPSVSDSHRE